MQELGRRLLAVYLGVTLCLGVMLLIVLIRYGSSGFYAFQAPGHGSSLAVNFIVFCLCWLFLGALIGLSQAPDFARRHGAFLLVLTLMAFAYLNAVREPHQITVGDFGAYVHAAECMRRGVPIEQRPDRMYLYPPLLATALSPFVAVGIEELAKAFRLLNYLAVLLLLLLLYLALLRFRFTPEVAAVALLCAFAANVPISRTIIYGQINLHVENLILLSFLLFGRHNLLSALCLGLAAHLKVSPLILALPFMLAREWRWCGWFIVCHAMIVVATSVANSPQYYADFLRQASAIRETALRNVSIDALVHNTLRLAGLGLWGPQPVLVYALRALLGLAILGSYVQLAYRDPFGSGEGSRRLIANGFVILPLLMLAVSPSIWEHHFVFLILPMLVVVPALREPRDFWLYGLAYLFMFLFPVYDIYPVSYLRLLGVIFLLFLYFGIAGRSDDAEAAWFGDLKRRLAVALGKASTSLS